MLFGRSERWSDCLVLLVDDNPKNLQVLGNLLEGACRTAVAINGQDALKFVQKRQPALILLDIAMPGMDGFEVCRRLKASAVTHDIPVIFISALSENEEIVKGLRLGAVDYITKPFCREELMVRVQNHLRLKCYQDDLEEMVRIRTLELMRTQDVTIRGMAILAETRDSETGAHIQRTQNYVRLLAEHLKRHPSYASLLSGDIIDLLYRSAPLHDIGKVGVSDRILQKPGKLTDQEFEQMKKHTLYGRNALLKAEKDLGTNSFLRYAKEIAYTHHEKWNGRGYPQGLRADAIPLSGRIMAIADVYDALISRRVYKPPFAHSQAVDMIVRERGVAFDPDIVDAFLKLEDQFAAIAVQLKDLDNEAVIHIP